MTNRRALRGLALVAGLIALCFGSPLVHLAQLAWSSDLYSYAVLVPFLSVYLVWCRRQELFAVELRSSRGLALGLASCATLLLIAGMLAQQRGWQASADDRLAVQIGAFVVYVLAAAAWFLGGSFLAKAALPAVIFAFVIPFPTVVIDRMEVFLQHASADAASVLFDISGTPVFRRGLFFHLPGIWLEVARECSGIRSSLVLLVTSLAAAYLLLETSWRRLLLVLFVVPLGVIRNGLRIFCIGMLCVHVDPSMINSWVHKKGGPLFFVLSLVPFFAFLVLLRRSELKRSRGSVVPG